MFMKKLEIIFISMIFISLFVLAKSWYDGYVFDTSPINEEYKNKISLKEQEVLSLMKKNYGFSFKVPLIITDKISGKLYGVTSYENDGTIKIYLNKKVMKESMEYMIDNVIAHEYAHALLFKQRSFTKYKDGHNPLWEQACKNLGAKNCERYVNHNDVVMGKMPF